MKRGIATWWPDRHRGPLQTKSSSHDSEKQVEKYLVRGFKDRGGVCWKWTSPGRSGVPDRIGLLPGARFYFIEVKTVVGKLSKIQKLVHGVMRRLGFEVHTVHGKNGVDQFFKEVVD